FTLSELESKLSAGMFIRCHRNYIINLYKIKEVIPWFNSTLLLTVEDNTHIEVPVSRNKVKEIKERLNL
ncbi:MAG: two component transcriptional regulator, LytTR family, partial [Clostridiales bacterium]|nr:two component transcriptional regulator, LytTR family [Clostridiales bacterium]